MPGRLARSFALTQNPNQEELFSMTKQDILIIHGTDYKEMAKQILTRADVAALIGHVLSGHVA